MVCGPREKRTTGTCKQARLRGELCLTFVASNPEPRRPRRRGYGINRPIDRLDGGGADHRTSSKRSGHEPLNDITAAAAASPNVQSHDVAVAEVAGVTAVHRVRVLVESKTGPRDGTPRLNKKIDAVDVRDSS